MNTFYCYATHMVHLAGRLGIRRSDMDNSEVACSQYSYGIACAVCKIGRPLPIGVDDLVAGGPQIELDGSRQGGNCAFEIIIKVTTAQKMSRAMIKLRKTIIDCL